MKTIFCFEEILICCQFNLLEGKVDVFLSPSLHFIFVFLMKIRCGRVGFMLQNIIICQIKLTHANHQN